MSDSGKNFVSAFLEELRQIVRDEVRASTGRQDIEDRLLTAGSRRAVVSFSGLALPEREEVAVHTKART